MNTTNQEGRNLSPRDVAERLVEALGDASDSTPTGRLMGMRSVEILLNCMDEMGVRFCLKGRAL